MAAMHATGVRTLYLETSNYHAPSAIVSPDIVSRFIVAAHADGMRVVAWYLPSFGRPVRDRSRSMAGIRFRTSGGEAFDAFALDIESTQVANPSLRTTRLLDLASDIRRAAGSAYSLGAIVPAPVAMRDRPDYWPGFPFRRLRPLFDVFLPMDYYTYHFTTARDAHDYTAGNISLLRSETRDPELPVHVIGGLADGSSVGEVTAFVHGERELGVLGASLYDDAGTSPGQWAILAGVPSNPIERPALPVRLPYAGALGNIPGADRTHPNEVFYSSPGVTGAYTVRYRGYNLGAGEVELWVNWRFVRTLRPTASGAWSGARHATVPPGLLTTSRRNYVQFTRATSAPPGATWGIRGVALVPAT